MKKVLVVAAHPDDELLGLGGTVRKHVENGDLVECLILGEGMASRTGEEDDLNRIKISELHKDTLKAAEILGFQKISFADFPDNRFDSVALLDIIKVVEEHIDSFSPSVVYTHFAGDLNIDHKITNMAVLTATRPISPYSVKEIYAFETASATEWNFGSCKESFVPNVFVDIGDTLEAKLSAMACYSSEIREFPHPRSLKALKIIAAKWGVVIGTEYAEAFQLIRKVI